MALKGTKKKEKVFVAMSGGVDSSVAAPVVEPAVHYGARFRFSYVKI